MITIWIGPYHCDDCHFLLLVNADDESQSKERGTAPTNDSDLLDHHGKGKEWVLTMQVWRHDDAIALGGDWEPSAFMG